MTKYAYTGKLALVLTFPVAVIKFPQKKQFKRERFILVDSSRIHVVHRGVEYVTAGA